jgi:hypothetical protein
VVSYFFGTNCGLIFFFLIEITTRKHVFGNRFRDRKISVTIETDLETDILNVNLKKIQSLYRLLHNYRDQIRDQ